MVALEQAEVRLRLPRRAAAFPSGAVPLIAKGHGRAVKSQVVIVVILQRAQDGTLGQTFRMFLMIY